MQAIFFKKVTVIIGVVLISVISLMSCTREHPVLSIKIEKNSNSLFPADELLSWKEGKKITITSGDKNVLWKCEQMTSVEGVLLNGMSLPIANGAGSEVYICIPLFYKSDVCDSNTYSRDITLRFTIGTDIREITIKQLNSIAILSIYDAHLTFLESPDAHFGCDWNFDYNVEHEMTDEGDNTETTIVSVPLKMVGAVVCVGWSARVVNDIINGAEATGEDRVYFKQQSEISTSGATNETEVIVDIHVPYIGENIPRMVKIVFENETSDQQVEFVILHNIPL